MKKGRREACSQATQPYIDVWANFKADAAPNQGLD